MDESIRRRPFRVSEALRECLNCFRHPFLNIGFDKDANEVVIPLRTPDIQTAFLERLQRWEPPELREGRKAIKLGVIELSVETFDLERAPYAGNFDLDDSTMLFNPSKICLYLGPKDLEVYRYN